MNTDQMLMDIRERSRLYISTPERAAEALLFAKNLEKFADELKANVKERAIAIMDRDGKDVMSYTITDQDTGEVREWKVSRDYDKSIKEYRVENIIEAFGLEIAKKFFKISKGDVDKYMAKAVSKGEITSEQTFKAVENAIVKTRKGAGVIMREVKA